MSYGPGKLCSECDFDHWPDDCPNKQTSVPPTYDELWTQCIKLEDENNKLKAEVNRLYGVGQDIEELRVQLQHELAQADKALASSGKMHATVVETLAKAGIELQQAKALARWRKKGARHWFDQWRDMKKQRNIAIATQDMLEARLNPRRGPGLDMTSWNDSVQQWVPEIDE